MQKRKGFTLVELVIVIAVIAILAGVLIGTFASVINRANESAKLQELKAQELEQKSNDILKKIEDSNWYGWEDFETSIVEKMTKVYASSQSQGATVGVDDIKKAVKDAIKEYSANSTTNNTELTEEQVKVIVEDAIGKIQYNGVTEAQVKTIIETAVANQTTSLNASALTAAQVKTIIETANASNLSAADVAKVIGTLDLTTKSNLNEAVTSILTEIEKAAGKGLSSADLSNAIMELLPVTYKVASTADLSKALAGVNSFSTLYFTNDLGNVEISLEKDDTRTLTIAGAKQTRLTIDAPLATINIVNEQGEVVVNEINDSSLHISTLIASLLLKKGRVVVENGGTITALTAAPTQNAVVKVEVDEKAVVEALQLGFNKTEGAEKIVIKKLGTISTLTMTVVTDTTTSVAVQGATAQETAETLLQVMTTAGVEDPVVFGDNNRYKYDDDNNVVTNNLLPADTLTKSGDDYLIRNADELRLVAELINGDDTYETYGNASFVITNDIDLSGKTWIPIGQELSHAFKGSFDGEGHVVSGMSNYADFEYAGSLLTSLGSKKINELYGLFNFVGNGAQITNINLKNIDVNMPANSNGGGVGGGLVAYVNYDEPNGTVQIKNCTVSGRIVGFDCIGSIVGRSNYGSGAEKSVTIENCTSSATLTVLRTVDGYARIGGIVGYSNGTNSGTTTVKNCTFSGRCNGRLYSSSTNVSMAPCGLYNGEYLCGATQGITITE